MSIEAIAHQCHCEDPTLGVIDKDSDTVYCNNCDGILGDLNDINIVIMADKELSNG